MSSFRFLPPDKPTWKIHAALSSYGTARGDPIFMEGTVFLSLLDVSITLIKLP